MKNNSRSILIGIVILIAAVAVGAIVIRYIYSPDSDNKLVRIGAILPLTGEGSVWGKNSQKGIDLAIEELNNDGSLDFEVQIVYEDSQTEAKHAVSALRKLISQFDIQCSVVDMISSNVLAMAPIANSNKVVIISPGASSADITASGPFVFRNWPSDAVQGTVNAEYAAEKKKWRKVGVVYVLNAYGEGLKDSFTQHFEAAGGKVLITVGIKQGASDARSQILKLKQVDEQSKLDFLYLAVYPTEHPVLLKQLDENNLKLPLLATETFDDPKIHKIPSANRVIFSVPAPPDPTSTAAKDFKEKFKKKYGEDPGITADAAYDAIKLLVRCIGKVGNDGSKIRDCLAVTKNYPGAAGVTSFDENGDIIKPFVFKTIKSGNVVDAK